MYRLALAVGLTTASYLVLSGYDKLALRAIGQRQPWPVCALAAFTSYTLSHNLGFAPITGGAARWRVYGPRGMAFADVARIVVIAGVTFWLGVFLVMGVALVAAPGALRIDDWVAPYGLQAAAGLAILLGIAGYLTMTAFRPRPLALLGWSLPVPSLGQAVAQFALAAAEIALATAALAVLVPGVTLADYPDFIIAYVMAMVVALISHTPGGLGVFEAVIIVAMPDVDRAGLVSALIAYRLIYYLIPLALALALLGGIEMRGRRTIPAAGS